MSKQPSFRQRVINRIRREGLRMGHWLPTECGTACCIAGNIALEAGARPAWKYSLCSVVGPLLPGEVSTEEYARAAWAAEYGEQEANRLDFYFTAKRQPLEKVLPSQAIWHLRDIRVR